jgi:hypothetical protein
MVGILSLALSSSTIWPVAVLANEWAATKLINAVGSLMKVNYFQVVFTLTALTVIDAVGH